MNHYRTPEGEIIAAESPEDAAYEYTMRLDPDVRQILQEDAAIPGIMRNFAASLAQVYRIQDSDGRWWTGECWGDEVDAVWVSEDERKILCPKCEVPSTVIDHGVLYCDTWCEYMEPMGLLRN